MKTIKKTHFFLFFALGMMLTILPSCSKEKKLTATINVAAATNNKSGDIQGNGGTTTRSWNFTNSNRTLGWDMSINSTSGSFRLVIKDASGTILLDKTLVAGVGAQSADGTTIAGTAGEWNATITLSSFLGTGDFSFL